MQAKIEWQRAVEFKATTESEHHVTIDGPPSAGGSNAGMRPMELMLLGVAGCTSFDVVSILQKSRCELTSCTTLISAERADTTPAVFESIHIHFDISGQGLDEKKVARAVSLSADKYCSASIMLQRAGVNITHDFTIIANEDGGAQPQ